jgi:hypothetical protein
MDVMANKFLISALGPTVAGLILLSAGQARADVIDGEWCRLGGHHMSIKGPQIVTPAGSRTQGNYSRHSFIYVVPQADPGAGQKISMILVNENTVHLSIDAPSTNAPPSPMQVWHRCTAPVISARHMSANIS